MSEPSSEFQYIFGEKEELLLVLFQGKISSRALSRLETFEAELAEKPSSIVLFVFRDVVNFMPVAHAPFVKILKSLRDRGKIVGLCSLKPEIKTLLLQAGIIRESEVFNNIPDAWSKLSQKLESVNKTKAAN